MIIVTGLFEIAPKDVDKVKALLARTATATRAEAGCLTYAFYENIEQPGLIRVYEEWETYDALKSHFGQPHMADMMAGLANAEVLRQEVYKITGGEKSKLG